MKYSNTQRNRRWFVFGVVGVLLLLPALVLCGPAFKQTRKVIGKNETNLVAFYGQKKVMGAHKEYVGKNFQVRARVEGSGDKYKVVVEIPVTGFKSGSSGRDRSVHEELGSDKHPTMVFRSNAYGPDTLKKLNDGQTVRIKGKLKFGGKSRSLVFSISQKKHNGKTFIQGYTWSSLTALGIDPPSIAVLKVFDYVQLHIKMDVSRIANWPG